MFSKTGRLFWSPRNARGSGCLATRSGDGVARRELGHLAELPLGAEEEEGFACEGIGAEEVEDDNL